MSTSRHTPAFPAYLAFMLANHLWRWLEARNPDCDAATAAEQLAAAAAAPVEQYRGMDDVARMMGLEPVEPADDTPPWDPDADAGDDSEGGAA